MARREPEGVNKLRRVGQSVSQSVGCRERRTYSAEETFGEIDCERSWLRGFVLSIAARGDVGGGGGGGGGGEKRGREEGVEEEEVR